MKPYILTLLKVVTLLIACSCMQDPISRKQPMQPPWAIKQKDELVNKVLEKRDGLNAQSSEILDENTAQDTTLEVTKEPAVKAQKIVLYGNPQCGYCKASEQLLKEKNIPYKFHNVAKDKSLLTKLNREIGPAKFPYVFIDDEYIGGFSELQTIVNTKMPKRLKN